VSDQNGDVDGDDDPWPDEPDEFDPERLGPRVRVPEAPDPPSPDRPAADVSPELARAFWTTVVLVNAEMLGVSVGAMVVVFQGELRRGGGLAVVGLVAFALAYRRYLLYRDGSGERSSTSAPADGGRASPESDAGDTANRPEK
jgi:hypothetical protein